MRNAEADISKRGYGVARHAALVILGMAVVSGPAHAGYIDITQALSYVEASGDQYQEAYNWTGTGGGTGSHTYGGCGSSVGTCSGSGTVDSSGHAFSSYDGTSISVVIPPYPPLGRPEYDASASANAVASIPDGTVGVAAAGTYLDYLTPSSGQAGGTGSSFAEIGDVLHFSILGATSSTVTDIGVSFTIDGSMGTTTAAGDSGGSVSSTFGFGSAHYNDSISLNGPSYNPVVGTPSVGGWLSYSFSTRTPDLIVFDGVYTITGGTADIDFSESLSAHCGLGTECAYDHTGAFDLSLPAGVTFTSDSGVLLTAATPEPASVWLLVIGIAVMGLARVRQSARNPR